MIICGCCVVLFCFTGNLILSFVVGYLILFALGLGVCGFVLTCWLLVALLISLFWFCFCVCGCWICLGSWFVVLVFGVVLAICGLRCLFCICLFRICLFLVCAFSVWVWFRFVGFALWFIDCWYLFVGLLTVGLFCRWLVGDAFGF